MAERHLLVAAGPAVDELDGAVGVLRGDDQDVGHADQSGVGEFLTCRFGPVVDEQACAVLLELSDDLFGALAHLGQVCPQHDEVEVCGAAPWLPSQSVVVAVEAGEGLQAAGDADAGAGHVGGCGGALGVGDGEAHGGGVLGAEFEAPRPAELAVRRPPRARQTIMVSGAGWLA